MNVKMDDCFQFGLGAFETISVVDGRPIFLDRHLRRLEDAARFLDLGMPAERGIDRIAVLEYLRKWMSEHDYRDQSGHMRRCALKIMLTQKNVVFSMRDNPYTTDIYERGVAMDISNVRRNETSPFVYHKTMNYGDCILEKRRSRKAGMDERIFLNTKGQICEGTVSNIFFVRDGRIYTPAIDSGLMPGTVRGYICESEAVTQTVIFPDELSSYQECFVTNSLMGVMPVKLLGNISFEERSVTARMMRKYHDFSASCR